MGGRHTSELTHALWASIARLLPEPQAAPNPLRTSAPRGLVGQSNATLLTSQSREFTCVDEAGVDASTGDFSRWVGLHFS